MGIEAKVLDLLGRGFLYTKANALLNWGRSNSVWFLPFGTACCAIEMMAAYGPRYDIARFGSEVMRFSPRQADVMIVSGRVAIKMMPILIKVWRQMAEPKWCISMGACACTGGIFNTYTMVQGIDKFIPVDIYMPGCPPRPETMLDALMEIQKMMKKYDNRSRTGKDEAYSINA